MSRGEGRGEGLGRIISGSFYLFCGVVGLGCWDGRGRVGAVLAGRLAAVPLARSAFPLLLPFFLFEPAIFLVI